MELNIYRNNYRLQNGDPHFSLEAYNRCKLEKTREYQLSSQWQLQEQDFYPRYEGKNQVWRQNIKWHPHNLI
ncbi:hypothetical protein D3C80_1259270 [compost metagenome]